MTHPIAQCRTLESSIHQGGPLGHEATIPHEFKTT